MPWWSWMLLIYSLVGVEMAGAAFRSNADEFRAKNAVVWVASVIVVVIAWPAVWWAGRR